MKKHASILAALVAAGVVASCVPAGPEAAEASLVTSVTAVTVDSDNFLNFDPFVDNQSPIVTDTVTITSSVSWTATVVTADGGAWVRPSIKERINVSGKPEDVQLVLTFDRYRGIYDRTADLTLYGAGIEQPVVIPVTQKAWVPVLEAYAYPSSFGIPAVNGESYVVIKSNTVWTARIDEGASTVVPSLSAITGEGTSAVLLSFPANTDDEKAVFTTFVAEADGCPEQRVEFIQSQSDRYFFLASEMPEEVEPYESRILIPLRSNGAWTAEISDCTFANAALEPSYGNLCLNGIYFTADHGFDPEVEEKHATVTIHRAGMEDLVCTFSQKGCIHLCFSSFDPEYVFEGRYSDPDTPYSPYVSNGYPFSIPASVPSSFNNRSLAGEVTDFVMRDGGWIFTMFGASCGIWNEPSSFCWMVGKSKNDYVLFPAVEEMRLAKMYYEASCRLRVPYTVRTEDGSSIIKGGEFSETKKVVPVNTNHHDVHTHVFPSTEAGARYRLNLEEDYYGISIKDLCLVYEK